MSGGPDLAALQAGFAAMIDGDDAALAAHVVANGLAPQARLSIYRHAVHALHAEALATTYPALRAWVGEDCFDTLAADLARHAPSRSGNLQRYGAAMAERVAAADTLAGFPWLPDLAALEWARQCSVLSPHSAAAGAEPLLQRLQMSDGALRLLVQPHVRVLVCAYAVLDMWSYAMVPGSAQPDTRPCDQGVLIWCERGQVAMSAVSPDAARALQALADGRSVNQVLAGVDEAQVQAVLQPLIAHGLLVDVVDIERH